MDIKTLSRDMYIIKYHGTIWIDNVFCVTQHINLNILNRCIRHEDDRFFFLQVHVSKISYFSFFDINCLSADFLNLKKNFKMILKLLL